MGDITLVGFAITVVGVWLILTYLNRRQSHKKVRGRAQQTVQAVRQRPDS